MGNIDGFGQYKIGGTGGGGNIIHIHRSQNLVGRVRVLIANNVHLVNTDISIQNNSWTYSPLDAKNSAAASHLAIQGSGGPTRNSFTQASRVTVKGNTFRDGYIRFQGFSVSSSGHVAAGSSSTAAAMVVTVSKNTILRHTKGQNRAAFSF